MKKISILIPTYNEADNLSLLYDVVRAQLLALADRYDYEIVFIDNKSTDGTRAIIRQLCAKDERVKAIFNARNFGSGVSSYYGSLQTTGDCTIGMCADFQDPPEYIPQMIEAWEQGSKIVCMVKTQSREHKGLRFVRTLYYKVLNRFSDVALIEHFSSFGLWDKSVMDIGRRWGERVPFLRGMTAEAGYGITILPYTQQKRRKGKSSYRFFKLYDDAMVGITRYTKVGLRLATLLGVLLSGVSALIAVVLLIVKLASGDASPLGLGALGLGLFFLGGVQLFFMGMLGEYILSIQRYSMNRPLVFEEERINFDEKAGE
ncbi:MAG: glycosyltransferase family 2 protein [Oscillospiraceae bacterium]|jgi:glycosyltransferase involved in cell wall biosynthesis|nr:glycosyltransferase family 2 protein [Oscillospiraceae bacterium]